MVVKFTQENKILYPFSKKEPFELSFKRIQPQFTKHHFDAFQILLKAKSRVSTIDGRCYPIGILSHTGVQSESGDVALSVGFDRCRRHNAKQSPESSDFDVESTARVAFTWTSLFTSRTEHSRREDRPEKKVFGKTGFRTDSAN